MGEGAVTASVCYVDVRHEARCWAYVLPTLLVPMAHGDNIRQTDINPEKHLVMVLMPSVGRAVPLRLETRAALSC